MLNPNYRDPYPWLNAENVLKLEVGAFAAAGASVSLMALPQAMASSETFGLASSRFGNNFFRGGAGQGSWNYGPTRLGWS